MDSEGNIKHINQAAVNLTGWSAKDSAGLQYGSVLNFINTEGQESAGTDNPIARTLLSHKVNRSVLLIKNDDKQTYIDISASPLLSEQGQLNGVVAVLRDVSAQKKQELERSDFISTASHEMRTPVAAIRGYLELALNPKICQVDDKARDYLQKSLSSTEHLGQLFQDLLTVTKSEDGRLPSNPIKLEINTFLRDSIEQLKMSAEKKGLQVNFGFENISNNNTNVVEPMFYSFVDPERLREVIGNLFDNAVKYTARGSVTIRLGGDIQNVRILISDTGLGIPAEDLSHLFQKFYRVDSSATREIGGTGLGLYICKQIVETMHGTINVTSTIGRGTTFTIQLPRVK
jgi:PAS domain S-box-containing protein